MQASMVEANIFKILQKCALDRPNEPALYYSGQQFSFKEILLLCRQLAQSFRDAGIKRRSTIFLDIRNPFLNWMCFLALYHEGCISCSIPLGLDIPENVEIDCLITDCNEPRLIHANTKITLDQKWISELSSISLVDDITTQLSSSDICRLIFTSGSTGRPKIVALSSQVLMDRCNAINDIDPQVGCELIFPDVSNSIGLYKAIRGLLTGIPISFATSYQQILHDVMHIPVAHITGSPLQLSSLADFFKKSNTSSTHHIKRAMSAGSKIGSNIFCKINTYIANDVISIYGSTEAGPVAVYSNEELRKLDDSGAVILGFIQLDINHSDSETNDASMEGAVRIRSPMICNGYYSSGSAIKDVASEDGWFYPGDTAYLQNKNHLILTGRVDDVMNIGGVKINPLTIDQLLLSLFGVKEAITFAAAGESDFPIICCAIVSDQGFSIESASKLLTSHFGAYLTFKIILVESLPKTPSGKPSRSAMREKILKDVLAP